jgi:hypothetical protein
MMTAYYRGAVTYSDASYRNRLSSIRVIQQTGQKLI